MTNGIYDDNPWMLVLRNSSSDNILEIEIQICSRTEAEEYAMTAITFLE
jgi:hypothetical protein